MLHFCTLDFFKKRLRSLRFVGNLVKNFKITKFYFNIFAYKLNSTFTNI